MERGHVIVSLFDDCRVTKQDSLYPSRCKCSMGKYNAPQSSQSLLWRKIKAIYYIMKYLPKNVIGYIFFQIKLTL